LRASLRHLCAGDLLPSAALPQGSHLLCEHLRAQVLHSGLRPGLCSGHLCAEVLPRAALPSHSDLPPEHLRTEVLPAGHLRPGSLCSGLRSGPGLRSGLRSGDLCAEDLLPEALQARPDMPSEHLRSEVLYADVLCAGLRSGLCARLCARLCSGDLCAEVLQRAVPPRASLPQESPLLQREHLRSELLRSSRPLLRSDYGSTVAGSGKHAAGSGPREEDLSMSVLTDEPQKTFGVL
jgi:hypothetical protein